AHPRIDIRPFYKQADNHVDQALRGVHEILIIISPESFDPFSAAMSGIDALEKNLQSLRSDIAGLLRDSKSKTTQISSHSEKAGKIIEEMTLMGSQIKEELESYKTIAQNNSNETIKQHEEVSKLLQNISEIHQKAAS